MMRTYWVYIMASRSRVLYTGVTNDLGRRVKEHKASLIPGFTQRYRITRLVYFEEYRDIRDAIAREKQILRAFGPQDDSSPSLAGGNVKQPVHPLMPQWVLQLGREPVGIERPREAAGRDGDVVIVREEEIAPTAKRPPDADIASELMRGAAD